MPQWSGRELDPPRIAKSAVLHVGWTKYVQDSHVSIYRDYPRALSWVCSYESFEHSVF